MRRVQVDGLAAVPYAYAAVAPARAELVSFAGACPLDADGRTVGPGDAVNQTVARVANMQTALAASGARLVDIVFVRHLVASGDWGEMAAAWEIVREAFGELGVPGTLQGVTVLGWKDQLVGRGGRRSEVATPGTSRCDAGADGALDQRRDALERQA